MEQSDAIFHRIAEALLFDYSNVYYVNAKTSKYIWYSINREQRTLRAEQGGDDFFADMAREAQEVIYEEDKKIFLTDMRREKLLEEMERGTMQSNVYRLMIDGKPKYHMLRLIRGVTADEDYFILGVMNVDKEIHERRAAAEARREREIFTQIASSLAEHYDTLYYINMLTDHYIEFSSRDTYKQMHVPPEGDDFFGESLRNVDRFVHPEDRKQVESLHRKDVLLKNLESKKTFTATYRLIIAGTTMHCRLLQMWASDHRHVIMCVENINEEVAREENLRRTQTVNVTYSQIAERLAEHYDNIYYVDTESEEYVEFSSSNLLQVLTHSERDKRKQFFEQVKQDIEKVIYPEDQMMLHAFFNKDLLLEGLRFPDIRQIEYRLVADGAPVYVRLSAMFTKDLHHLLLCVENIDQQVRALHMANELARTDKLTGTKNKNAYQEQEKELQAMIDVGALLDFAIVVCDLNNLKRINDTFGHKAGDEYIKAAGKVVCELFAHSPVYRIGGDEFVAVLTDRDYERREDLFAQLRERMLDNLHAGVGPVVASGMAEYRAGSDKKVSEVFERADGIMYEYKRRLKSGEIR